MRARLTLLGVLALTFAGTATAITAPPAYWWTAKKANRTLIANNPQMWSDREGHKLETQILTSSCKGVPPKKLYRGALFYRTFSCRVGAVHTSGQPTTFSSRLACWTLKPRGFKCAIGG